MDIEQVLRSRLIATPGVVAALGQRIYPLVVPLTATLPALAYQRISTVRTPSHSTAVPLARMRWQLMVVSEDYAGAKAGADALRRALDNSSFTSEGVLVHSAFLDSEGEEYAEIGERFVCRLDFMIMYEER